MANPAPDIIPSSIASRQAISVVIAVTPANTPKNLYTLLAAVSGYASIIRNACELIIQNTGATTIALGRSTMATIADGEQLLSQASDTRGPFEKNTISLTDIWLISDADNGSVVITALSA